MAGQEYILRLGIDLNSQGAVQKSAQSVDQILANFRRLQTARIDANPLKGVTAADMLPLQQAVRTAVERGATSAIRGSSVFQSLATDQKGQPVYGGAKAQSAIIGTTPDGPGSALFEARSKLTRALINQAQVQEEINKRTAGQYDTPAKRLAANAQAAERVSAAQRGVTTQYERLAKDIAGDLARNRREVDAELTARGQLINTLNRQKQVVERAAAREETQQRAMQEAEGRAILALERRARVDAEAGRADASIAGFQPSYPGANLATRTGRLEGGVNEAERKEMIARERLTAELNKETRTVASVNSAQLAHERAERNLAAAQERLAIQTGHLGTSFIEQFRTGFAGQSHRPYAEQIGQAFKFSVFYGAAYRLLDGITQTFAQTLQEGIEFQQAVAELTIATGRTEGQINDLANSLGERAAEAGFAPSAGVLIGARSIGLYGATDAQGGTASQQAAIADISARVVSRLAFSSGQQPADLQTNIAAIVNAFGGGPEGQFRVADLDAYMSHFFGVAPGSTVQAVSEAGTVGRAAGFDQEQVSAIAADLMARTGQTAPAVAGFMAQIFSRGGEGSLTSVAQRYNIDPTLELSKQIEQLAEVYKTATPQERAEISAGFGRGKVQNAAIALLQDYDNVQLAAQQAREGGATGAADKQFNLRLANVGGQIQVTLGSLREFANQLGQSGVLSVLGAFILVGRETVEALTGVLRIWNSLPGTIKATAAALGLLALAARTQAVQGALAGRLGTVVGGRRYVEAATGTGVVPAASAAGARGLVTSALGGLVNPVTAAIGGLLAIGAFKNKADDLSSALETTTRTLNKGPAAGSSIDDLRSHAAALDASAEDTRQASSGIRARVINFGADRRENLEAAKAAEIEADRLRALAAGLERNAVDPIKQLITGFDTTSLERSMEEITTGGGTAATRLDALADAINGTGDAALRARESFNPQLFAGDQAQGVRDAAARAGGAGASGGIYEYSPGIIKGFLDIGKDKSEKFSGPDSKNILPDLIKEQLSQSDVQSRLQDALSSLTSLDDIDTKTAESIARSVLGDTAATIGASQGLSEGEISTLQESMVDSVGNYLTMQVKGLKEVIDGTIRFSPEQLVGILDQTIADVEELTSNLPQTDYSGRIAAFQSALKTARQAAAKTQGDLLPKAEEDLAQLRLFLSNAQIDELEALRRARQHAAGSKREVAAIGARILRREINAAVRGGNQDRLAEIIGQAGNGAIRLAREAIMEAVKVAKAAFKMKQDMASFAASMQPGLAGMESGDIGEFKNPYADMLDALDTMTPGGRDNNVYKYGDAGYQAPPEAAAGSGETKADRAVAAAQARAIRSESPIQQAKADMYAARVAMDQAKKGTVEYYNALGQYYAARNSLTDAILEYKRNKYLLGIDITDPVAQAAVELRVARDKLRSDAGKGADVRAADQVAVRQAQADLEAQKFQQRLQTVQTAEQLGRISHQAYIRYLDNEKDRLEGIKNRTFQQQQQLDQIDGLLQEAAGAMDAQFNLGDIKLPTVYQVRRTIAESGGGSLNDRNASRLGGGASLVNSNNTTTIYIDGADFEQVKKHLDTALSGRTVTTSSRRRIG